MLVVGITVGGVTLLGVETVVVVLLLVEVGAMEVDAAPVAPFTNRVFFSSGGITKMSFLVAYINGFFYSNSTAL